MTTFFTAESNLITEVKNRLIALSPNQEVTKQFSPRKEIDKKLSKFANEFIGVRFFEITTPGRPGTVIYSGKGTIGLEYQYDLKIQYPGGDQHWSQVALDDAQTIISDLINHYTTASGVQARWIKKDGEIIYEMNDKDNWAVLTLPLYVIYDIEN